MEQSRMSLDWLAGYELRRGWRGPSPNIVVVAVAVAVVHGLLKTGLHMSAGVAAAAVTAAAAAVTGQGSFPCDDACIPDTINNAHFVRDLYEKSNDTTGTECVCTGWYVSICRGWRQRKQRVRGFREGVLLSNGSSAHLSPCYCATPVQMTQPKKNDTNPLQTP
jgi:hypothetical protein